MLSQHDLNQQAQTEANGDDGTGFLEELARRETLTLLKSNHVLVIEGMRPRIAGEISVFHMTLHSRAGQAVHARDHGDEN